MGRYDWGKTPNWVGMVNLVNSRRFADRMKGRWNKKGRLFSISSEHELLLSRPYFILYTTTPQQTCSKHLCRKLLIVTNSHSDWWSMTGGDSVKEKEGCLIRIHFHNLFHNSYHERKWVNLMRFSLRSKMRIPFSLVVLIVMLASLLAMGAFRGSASSALAATASTAHAHLDCVGGVITCTEVWDS